MSLIKKAGIAAGFVALASSSLTFLPNTANAQLGGLGKLAGGGGAASGNIESDVKTFVDKSYEINQILAASSLAMAAAYASEEQRAKLQVNLDAMNKSTDPKEKNTLAQKNITSSSAELDKIKNSSTLAEDTKKMSAEKKKSLAQGVANFLIGALQAKDLVPTGQAVVQSATTNPMSIPKVLPIKDALPVLASAIENAAKTMPTFVSALKGANIKVDEVTSSSKPVSIKSLD